MGKADALDKLGSLFLKVEIHKNSLTVKADYEGFRGAQAAYATLIEVPGLGEGAYRYRDPQLGPQVVAYDGNGYFTVEWSPWDKAGPLPDGVETAIVETARATMIKLRVGDL